MKYSVDVAGIERRLTREQLIDRRAEGIDIIEMSAPLAVELLRAHVNERAAGAACMREHAHGISQAAGDSEVGHLQITALIYHEIVMHDARVIVRVIASIHLERLDRERSIRERI